MYKEVEYRIVVDEHFEALESKVNKMTDDGWVPTGGIGVDGGNDFLLMQAMTRDVDPFSVEED
jgi:hypothetical protein